MRIKWSAWLVAGVIQFFVGFLLFLFAILIAAKALYGDNAVMGFMFVMGTINLLVPLIAYFMTRIKIKRIVKKEKIVSKAS